MARDEIRPGRTKGWMVPLLLESDKIFGHGRWDWWLRALEDKRITTSIPKIKFRESREPGVRKDLKELSAAMTGKKGIYKNSPPLSPEGAFNHIGELLDKMNGGWDSLTYLIRWLAFALGVTEEVPRKSEYYQKWNDLLYEKFHLARLLAADADILGTWLAERKKGFNPTGFFPTPMSVCAMMVEMQMAASGDEDPRTASVCDPCAGTGRMLMAASNHSVNLHGMDMDDLVFKTCLVNMALFVPWALYPMPGLTAGREKT